MTSLPDDSIFRTHPDLTDLADRDRGHFGKVADVIQKYASDPEHATLHADTYGDSLAADRFRHPRNRRGGRRG